MKHTLKTLLAAALMLAGNLHAQIPTIAGAMAQLASATADPYAEPAAVANLLAAAEPLVTGNYTYGATDHAQTLNNELISRIIALKENRVSWPAARDYAVAKAAWHEAAKLAARTGQAGETATYAANWSAATPGSTEATLWLMRHQSDTGQDKRADVLAFLESNPPVDAPTAGRLLAIWKAGAGAAGTGATLNGFLETLLSETEPEHVPELKATVLLDRKLDGQNVNGEILALLGELRGFISVFAAERLYHAFITTSAANEQTLEFYDGLLRAVEATPASAAFLRRILDQKLKYQ